MKCKNKERANRVKQVFNDTGLNQIQFARLIGVSQQLVSAVINYKKKPNETIMFAIIDNIKDIDPMWLFAGTGEYTNNLVPLNEVQYPIDLHINNIVKKQFEELSYDILQKISQVEKSVKGSR